MRYRVRTKFGWSEEAVRYFRTRDEALFEAKVFIETWVAPEQRTGSLRGDGEVCLWENGERLGHVIVEVRNDNGYYERYQ